MAVRATASTPKLDLLFRKDASPAERALADIIKTLAWYAKHPLSPPRNSHDLRILLHVSIALASAGKL